jgi:hypothetical protein
VVGCDRSWESQNAVVAATRVASRRGCELVLLAIVEMPASGPTALPERVALRLRRRWRPKRALSALWPRLWRPIPRSPCGP